MGVPRTRWTPRPVIGSLRPGSASAGEGISDGLRKSTTTDRIAYVTAKKRRAVGYVRVSRVGGRSGDSFLSPDLQREQIEGVARREGLTIVEVIDELDASGGDADRPEWNRALDTVESVKPDEAGRSSRARPTIATDSGRLWPPLGQGHEVHRRGIGLAPAAERRALGSTSGRTWAASEASKARSTGSRFCVNP